MKRLVPILFFVLLSYFVGYLSMLFQQEALQVWYPSLVKSSLTPPGYVFSIVWGVLYLLMGISAGIVWSTRTTFSWVLAVLFVVQLALNLLWSVCFFYLRSPILGFAVLLLLFMVVLAYVGGCYKLNRLSAYLNVPYLLWLVFAGFLNCYIIIFN